MVKLLVRIDEKSNEAVEELKKYGPIKKVSFLLNLFSVQTSESNIRVIKRINGVIKVSKEGTAQLKVLSV